MDTYKEIRRVYAWDLAHELGSGAARPVIVCADDAMRTEPLLRIEGALSLPEFKSMRGSIAKDRAIVLYSTSLDGRAAVERAGEFERDGHTRVSILEGGINAWIAISPFLRNRRA